MRGNPPLDRDLNQLDRRQLEALIDGLTPEALEEFIDTLTAEQLGRIEDILYQRSLASYSILDTGDQAPAAPAAQLPPPQNNNAEPDPVNAAAELDPAAEEAAEWAPAAEEEAEFQRLLNRMDPPLLRAERNSTRFINSTAGRFYLLACTAFGAYIFLKPYLEAHNDDRRSDVVPAIGSTTLGGLLGAFAGMFFIVLADSVIEIGNDLGRRIEDLLLPAPRLNAAQAAALGEQRGAGADAAAIDVGAGAAARADVGIENPDRIVGGAAGAAEAARRRDAAARRDVA